MTTYSIDDGNGNQLTAGLQSYDTARRVAQRRANDLGATVYLYEQGRVADDENDVEGEPEAIEPETVRCACGAWSGHRCSWVGPESETVMVEYMPEQHRASHAAAGNRGTYPANGARRIRVERSCADSMVSEDGEWCTIVEDETTYQADIAAALEWAGTATAGDYLVEYEDTGLTTEQDPGSRCGYDDAELDRIRRALAARALRLVADDRGLCAAPTSSRSERIAVLAAVVGDDGTGDLG